MRHSINLVRAPVAALAMAALFAAPASAGLPQPNVEVMNENASDAHCGSVTISNHNVSGGCLLHAGTGQFRTFAHTGASEVVTSSCEGEFDIKINEGGMGYVDTNDTTLVTSPPNCGITPCDEPPPFPHEEYEWPVRISESTPSNNFRMIVVLCIRAANTAEGSIGNNCMVGFSISQTDHSQHFVATETACLENPAIEVSSEWNVEAVRDPDEVEIEIEHLI